MIAIDTIKTRIEALEMIAQQIKNKQDEDHTDNIRDLCNGFHVLLEGIEETDDPSCDNCDDESSFKVDEYRLEDKKKLTVKFYCEDCFFRRD